MKTKKLLIAFLLCSMVLSTVGCKDNTNDNDSSNSNSGSQVEVEGGGNLSSVIPEYTADLGEYFISAFGDPRALTTEAWQTMADCNINYVFIDPWYNATNIDNEANIVKALELCGEVGIKGLIMPNNAHGSTEARVSWEDYQVDYTQYEGFGGFYMYDEPNSTDFEWIVEDYAKYKESKYSEYIYFVTMMGGDYGGPLSQDEFFNKYSDEILSKFDDHTRMLSYDNYPLEYSPLLQQNNLRDSVIENIDRVAYHARENDADFYHYLQTIGYGYGENRVPRSIQDIRFQVALSMAFGAKGVECFTYSEFDNADFESSMLTSAGEKTDTWYWCRDVFGEIRAWEDVYLAFDYKGTMTVDTNAISPDADEIKGLKKCKIDKHARIKNMTAERDLLAGVFADEDGYDGFLFTTYNDPYYQKYNQISVEFNNASKALLYLNGQRQVIDLEDGALNWDLAAGDILFAIPIK